MKSKSIITDKEIEEGTIIVWSEEGNYDLYPESEMRCSCDRCDIEINEAFKLRDPAGTGYYNVCHKCLIDIARYAYPEKNSEFICPICLCSPSIYSGDTYECKFGHRWKVEKYIRKNIIKDD